METEQRCEGFALAFNASVKDPGILDTHEFSWDFGDGNTATGVLNPTHTYTDNGIYAVTLTVTDSNGAIATDTLTVEVNNVAPTPSAGSDVTVNQGEAIAFNNLEFQ